MNKKYTSTDEQILQDNYAKLGAKGCSAILQNFSAEQIKSKAHQMGLRFKSHIPSGYRECLSCLKIKPVDDFNAQQYRCRDCHRDVFTYDEKQRVAKRKYYLKHKVRLKANILKYKAARRQIDINYKILDNLRGRIFKAVRFNLKSARTLALIGCSVEELKSHLEGKFQKGMTWDNYGFYGWHIDHIKPCYEFDMSKPEQQAICFHYTNLQPLWAGDNLRRPKKLGAISQ